MQSQPESLPAFLEEIEGVIGRESAIAVAKEFGGQRVFFPQAEYLTENHRLVKAVGFDAARKLLSELFPAGLEITVPMGPVSTVEQRKQKVREMFSKGATANDVARECGMTVRNAYRHFARLRRKGQLT